MSRCHRTLAVAAATLVLVSATAARGEISRVALVDAESSLLQAVQVALGPWGIDVFVIRPPAPGATMPSSAERARTLARDHSAGAVVWISQADSDHALWVYDSDTGKVVALKLTTPPPLDDLAAASVALTVKALLRHSAVAPVAERVVKPAPPSARPPGGVTVEVMASVQTRPATDLALEGRADIAVAWYPAFARGRAGIAAGLSAGPGIEVNNAEFSGRFDDVSLSALLRGRLPVSGAIVLSAGIGPSLHVTRLQGVPLAGGSSVSQVRVNPSLDAALRVGVELGRGIEIGIDVHGSYLLRRQRYLAGTSTVLEQEAIEARAGLFVALPLRF